MKTHFSKETEAISMSITNIHLPAGKLFWGNILLILCSLFYLAWWCAAFKPHAAAGLLRTGLLFAATAVSGIGGLVLAVKGLTTIQAPDAPVSGLALLLGGAAMYLVLLAATGIFLKRQVTTELLLIVGWTVLELAAVNAFCGSGFLGSRAAVVLACLTVAAAVLSLLCYLAYYRLEETAGYIAGMIPLALAAAVMAAITAGVLL